VYAEREREIIEYTCVINKEREENSCYDPRPVSSKREFETRTERTFPSRWKVH
jgi:hypothetical protein